jgi:hypothetical protein
MYYSLNRDRYVNNKMASMRTGLLLFLHHAGGWVEVTRVISRLTEAAKRPLCERAFQTMMMDLGGVKQRGFS